MIKRSAHAPLSRGVSRAEFGGEGRELARFRKRIGVAAALIVLGFTVIAGRLFYLQVTQHDAYRAQAEENRISLAPVAPDRGLIVDRNGVVLARNQPGYALEIALPLTRDLEEILDDLAPLVTINARDRERFRRLLSEAPSAHSLPIRTRLSDEEAARFAVNRYRFSGVADISMRVFRHYPFGDAASHILGHIARLSAADAARLEQAKLSQRYRGADFIGRAGIESFYDEELHGAAGVEQVEVDAAGRRVRALSKSASEPGKNVILNIDFTLQRVAEEAFGERRGAAVALDPFSGAVLALASRPGFDPNLFVDGIAPQDWSTLNSVSLRPMLNRAVAGVYPPGSTFKPFMALAALELGKRTPGSTILDTGHFDFGGRRFRTASKPGGHGRVDLFRSIVVSSDVYYYQLAHDLGIDAIAAFMRNFRLGSATGIDLDGEASGVLPSREWKRERFRAAGQQTWYPGETISIGIGQGYNSYTPLQLASALATLVNGGRVFQPRLVAYTEDRRSRVRREVEPRVIASAELNPEHVRFIKRAMAAVNKEGTAARAFTGTRYTSGGKTGTAQVVAIKQNEKYDEAKTAEQHRDHSWFIAFAPVETPKIVLAVLVENGGFGARAAAPIARAMLDYYLEGELRPSLRPEAQEDEDDAAD